MRPHFKTLPPGFRRPLEQFSDRVHITDEDLSKIWIALLEAINNQELSSGYSPLFPDRILPDINELIVWIGDNFSVYIEKENDTSLRSIWKNINKRLCLVYFDEIERYDFIWEQDIEDKLTNQTELKFIFNYNEILPLVTNFKNTMQQKIGHLPYLGETKDNGDCFLLDKKIWRPDYNRIKTDPTISLQTCICTLLGIDDLFIIATIKDHLDFIDDFQGGVFREDDFIEFPSAHAGAFPKDINNTIKYREGWRDIISFVENFINAFTGHNHISLRDIDHEIQQCNIETSSFLKWAKESGYAIPDELAFNENSDGPLQRAGSTKDHIIRSGKTYTFPGKQITSWGGLKITLISFDMVEIETQDEKVKLTYHQLGMANQQNPERPKMVWNTLMLFATLDGKYPNKDVPKANLEKAKDRTKELNCSLKNFFNLSESIYRYPYNKKNCWETKFIIQSRIEPSRSQEDERSLHQIGVEEAQRKSNVSDRELYQD